MSSGKEPTSVKITLLPGQARVIVVASLPTNPSRDVTLKIPIEHVDNTEMAAFQGMHVSPAKHSGM